MQVTRVQWPVGQGNFSTGTIAAGDGTIQYVYDCGARSKRHLDLLVSAYARRTEKIDALFVSHLDGDHVDGLDTLLARLSTKTIYLPYLSVAERLLALAKAEAENSRFTASLFQAHFAPQLYFGSRGVERIVFVRGDDGSDGARSVDSPDPESHFARGQPELKDNAQPAPGAALIANDAALLEMDLADPIRLLVGGRQQNWILKPYVPFVTDARAQRFLLMVRRTFSLSPVEPITLAVINDVLKTPDDRARLRRCYDAVITDGGGRKHNAVSMSLYSGPAFAGNRWDIESRHRESQWWDVWSSGAPGWIGSGDAKLKTKATRRAWQRFYTAERQFTGTLLLPHHGSRENFHVDLLDPTIRVCVAAADSRHKGYRHPSLEVVDAIEHAGRRLAHVSKALPSRWIERIILR